MNGFLGIDEWPGNLARDGDAPTVLVLPGAGCPAQLPGLALPLRVLTLAGWRAFTASWTMRDITQDEAQGIVDEAITAFVADHATPDLVLAKSIGTMAAGWAAEQSVPAIWTTPLLTNPSCAEALARATAPGLLVAGTRDAAWDDGAAARSGLPIMRIDDADHGWRAGDWRREVAVLGELCEAVEDFAAASRRPPGLSAMTVAGTVEATAVGRVSSGETRAGRCR